MASALIGLGSNLGDRQANLDRAVQLLGAAEEVQLVRASRWLATKPVGQPPGADEFLNGAALLETTLPPDRLLLQLQSIENQLGRRRIDRWAPRTIDLDLLLYDDLIQRSPALELPHPRMAFRRFVLAPAAEIAGAMMHPAIGRSINQLLAHLDTAVPYVAIRGTQPSENRRLAAATSAKIGWQLLDFPELDELFTPASSTSLTSRRAIEFLRHAAAALTRESFAADRGAISSYWTDDVLAAVDARWPGEFEELGKSISPTLVPPKLLVDYASPQEPNEPMLHRGVGPVLRLTTSDAIAAESELLAAIEAMR